MKTIYMKMQQNSILVVKAFDTNPGGSWQEMPNPQDHINGYGRNRLENEENYRVEFTRTDISYQQLKSHFYTY